MDILKEWRMHRPTRRVDKFGVEFFSVPCKIINVEEERRPKDFTRSSDRKVDLEILNFETGELTYSKGMMYGKTYERFKDFNTKLPDYTYAKIVPRENSGLKIIVYKTSAYIPGILSVLIEKYCEFYGQSTDSISDDGLFEFSNNYFEINAWTKSKLTPPELNEFIFDDTNIENDGWDYFNDQLDMDQQGPGFWDSI